WHRVDFGDGGYALIDQNATNTENVTMYHTYFNITGVLIGFGRVLKTSCATEGQWSFKGNSSDPADVDPSVTHCDGTTDSLNGKVFATITGGATAANMTDVTFVGTPTTGMPAKYIARTVIDPNNANTAYVVFNGNAIAGRHVWKTTNLNNTGTGTVAWTVIDGTGIPDVSVNAFVVDRADSTHLYAGTDRGVFLSTDGGTT